ncbi:MAG TPA: hypothetical protein VMV92_18785 [Streptosporangiaceae bacterium]|nr:hypothetical protein [Streptosporangiaceae bacterium]
MGDRQMRIGEVGLVTPPGRTHGGFRLCPGADAERLLLVSRIKPLSPVLGWGRVRRMTGRVAARTLP